MSIKPFVLNKKKTKSAVGSYTTSVATTFLQALDFRTGEMDWEMANKSWYSANTIAGMLGAGVTGGLNTAALANTKISGSRFFGKAASFGISLAGEAVKLGTHTLYNFPDNYESGKSTLLDMLRLGFDDMGGLTFNLLNVSTIAKLFGVDPEMANKMKAGLFEVQITTSGVDTRFGTNCNLVTLLIAEATGFDTNFLLEPNTFNESARRSNTNANQMTQNLAIAAAEGRIMEINGGLAQTFANMGFTVIAAWENPTGRSGHIATVSPTLDTSVLYNYFYPNDHIPQISNVGSSNGILPAPQAFAGNTPTYYFYPNKFRLF